MGDKKKLTWIGVQCRNPLCGKAFPIHNVDGELMVRSLPQNSNSDETKQVLDGIKSKLSEIGAVSAGLNGAKTNIAYMEASSLLQHCPHCRRHYVYLLPDFFVTAEEIPHLPTISP